MALLFCGLPALLAACAGPSHTVSTAPPGETATPQGNLISGVIAAIRPATAQTALSPGAADVLAALQVAAPAQSPDATEFVIQRSDGNVAAVVLRSPESSPTASMSGADFAVGDQVELLTGNQTELIHRNP